MTPAPQAVSHSLTLYLGADQILWAVDPSDGNAYPVQSHTAQSVYCLGAGEGNPAKVDHAMYADLAGGAAAEVGPPGPAGPQGEMGPAGPQGAPGAQGDTGPAGPIGQTGPAGAQGQTGPGGSQGIQGAQGPQGSPGPIGPAGPQGSPGSTGSAGPQGVQGPPGPTVVSTDAGNRATLGTDGKIFVPKVQGIAYASLNPGAAIASDGLFHTIPFKAGTFASFGNTALFTNSSDGIGFTTQVMITVMVWVQISGGSGVKLVALQLDKQEGTTNPALVLTRVQAAIDTASYGRTIYVGVLGNLDIIRAICQAGGNAYTVSDGYISVIATPT